MNVTRRWRMVQAQIANGFDENAGSKNGEMQIGLPLHELDTQREALRRKELVEIKKDYESRTARTAAEVAVETGTALRLSAGRMKWPSRNFRVRVLTAISSPRRVVRRLRARL